MGMGMGMTIVQSFNILLVLLIWAAIIVCAVTLIKVLFKLNKALDIWLKEKEHNQNDAGD